MIIQAKVRPNQPVFSVKKKEDEWEISVKSPPKNNRANAEIIRNLSKEYKTVRILRGLKSSKKLILVE